MIAHRLRLRLLLDEGLPSRQSFPTTNAYCDIVHVTHELKKPGSNDQTLYRLATVQERIVVTLNIRDFRKLLRPGLPTVIGLSPLLRPEYLDKKLLALLLRLKPRHLTGHYFKIDRQTRVADLV